MKVITKLNSIKEFETSRLYARKIGESDFALVLPMYQNKKIMEQLGGPLSENAAKEHFLKGLMDWEQYGFGGWIWFEKNSNELIGRAGLRTINLDGKQLVDIGYILLPEFWRRGFATEMAAASIEIAFEVLQLAEITCFTSVTNKASRRVMEKLGFKYDHDFTYANEPKVLYRFTLGAYTTRKC